MSGGMYYMFTRVRLLWYIGEERERTLRDIIAPRGDVAFYEGLKSGPYGRSYGWLSFSWCVQYLTIPSTSTALSSATDAYD